MSLTFWDTVRGHQLADTLIRELPNCNEKGRQTILPLKKEQDVEDLQSELARGNKAVVTSFVVEGTTYVVTERRERR